MVFVTSDTHGYVDVLVEALGYAGLVDENQNWSGGGESLWVLGDMFDRGPDGVGVVDTVMRLQSQAAETGGRVGVILGNHEVLALGMRRFGRERSDDQRIQSLVLNWERNGGRPDDQDRLTDRHEEWLLDLPAMVDVEGHLLVHSDTTDYLGYGSTIDEINEGVSAALVGDIEQWWELVHRIFDRYAFARTGGAEVAADFMATLGVDRIVHGHSIIGDLRGIEPRDTDAALLYAGRRVLAVDGGIYAGGPCLVVNLDGWPDGRDDQAS